MDDSLPCPFCGAKAAPVNMSDSWFVACSGHDCMGMLGGFETKREALDKWNRRDGAIFTLHKGIRVVHGHYYDMHGQKWEF